MAKQTSGWIPTYGASDFRSAMDGPNGGAQKAPTKIFSTDAVESQTAAYKQVFISWGKSDPRVLELVRNMVERAVDSVTTPQIKVHRPFRKKVQESIFREPAVKLTWGKTVRLQDATLAARQEIVDQVTRQVTVAIVTKQVEEALQSRGLEAALSANAVSTASEPSDDLLNFDETLSAKDFGDRLGISDETVRLHERQQKTFSFLAPGRTRGREYPAFQLSPKIYGEPLEQVLDLLRTNDGSFLGGAVAYQFFVTSHPRLAHLAPANLLMGRGPAESPAAEALLLKSDAERLALTKSAAMTFAANADA